MIIHIRFLQFDLENELNFLLIFLCIFVCEYIYIYIYIIDKKLHRIISQKINKL